jgi:hypothetical protein
MAGTLRLLTLTIVMALGIVALGVFTHGAADPNDPPAVVKPSIAPEAVKNPVVVPPKKEPEILKAPSPTAEIRRLLSQPTDKLKTGVDKGTPLKDALDFICRIHEVRPGQTLKYRFDYRAFADAGEPNIEEKQIDLPPMPRAPLSVILDDLLSRIDPPEARGTFRICGDYIEFTTLLRVKDLRYFEQLVDLQFDKRPLADALQDVMDTYGVPIVVDSSIADKAKFPVSASFDRVPLHRVVRLMAGMADLEVVPVESMMYVTTKAKTEELRNREKQWKKDYHKALKLNANGP